MVFGPRDIRDISSGPRWYTSSHEIWNMPALQLVYTNTWSTVSGLFNICPQPFRRQRQCWWAPSGSGAAWEAEIAPCAQAWADERLSLLLPLFLLLPFLLLPLLYGVSYFPHTQHHWLPSLVLLMVACTERWSRWGHCTWVDYIYWPASLCHLCASTWTVLLAAGT